MKLAHRVLELYVIKDVFEKIREELLDVLENTTNEVSVIDMGKYINDLTTLIHSLEGIISDARKCINIKEKDYKRYDLNNDRVSNITDNTNQGIKILQELKVLYHEDFEKIDIHYEKVYGERMCSKAVVLNGTLHHN